MDLKVNSNLVIPSQELKWRFSRASGPGGQNLNKTDSRVELVFDLRNSKVITPFLKKRLITQLGSQLRAGSIRIVASEKRSQYQNRHIALHRLASLLIKGLRPLARARKPTKPRAKAKQRRLESKKHRGELKRNRQDRPSIDD